MTKDKTVTMSQELAERLTKQYTNSPAWDALEDDRMAATEELRALLAAPVVERQEPVAHQITYNDGETSSWMDGKPSELDIEDVKDGVLKSIALAYAAPAAVVAVAIPLEWSEISDPTEECRYTHVTAKTAIGTYSIEWKAHKQFDDRTLFLDGDHVSSGHDLAEAKAKAQEHHSARVMACLDKPKEPAQ